LRCSVIDLRGIPTTLPCRSSLDTSDPFLGNLWRVILDYFFPSNNFPTRPVLRLVYVAAAAVALAPRINEVGAPKLRFGAGYSRDSMPRGPADAAPGFVIDALTAISGPGDVAVVKWRDVLERVKLVRGPICLRLLRALGYSCHWPSDRRGELGLAKGAEQRLPRRSSTPPHPKHSEFRRRWRQRRGFDGCERRRTRSRGRTRRGLTRSRLECGRRASQPP
jgi:hypothetical protein